MGMELLRNELLHRLVSMTEEEAVKLCDLLLRLEEKEPKVKQFLMALLRF